MNTLSAADVGFIIKSYDAKSGKINVSPYSPLFKNSPDKYPVYSYDLASFDPTQDMETQLGRLLHPTVKSILTKESGDYTTLTAFIKDNLNVAVSLPLSSIISNQEIPSDVPYSEPPALPVSSNVNFVV
jgi:hypothetical protein